MLKYYLDKTGKVIKSILFPSSEFVDTEPRAGSMNPVTSGGVAGSVSQQSSNFAPNYTKKTYEANSYVMQDGVLYTNPNAIVTAEDWNPAHWTQTTVAEMMRSDVEYHPTVTWEDGKYIIYSSGNVAAASGLSASSEINVEDINKIRLYAKGASTADVRGAAFYDERGAFISGYQYPGANVDTVLNVPEGAKYFRFSTKTSDKSSSYIALLDVFGAVVNLRDQDDDIKNSFLKVRPSLTWEDGYYIVGTGGYKTAYSDYSCVWQLDIRGFKRISFIAFHHGTNDYSGYAFYDIHGRTIAAGKYTTGSGLYVETLDVPGGACFFSFTAQKSKKDLFYIELLQTNDAVLNHGKILREFQERELVVPFSMFSNFAACGDSYSSGQIYEGSTSLGIFPKVSWGKVLERMTGAECSIFSYPGMDVRSYRTHENCLPKLLTETAKELYIFALGINDYANEIPVGDISDIDDANSDNNADTFIGNYGYIIQKTLDHAPNAKIVILKSLMPVTSSGEASERYTYSSDAIEALATHYNCLYVETLDDVFLSSVAYTSGKIGGHPTAPLYAGMANAFNEIFKKLFFDNYTYFNDFTPT